MDLESTVHPQGAPSPCLTDAHIAALLSFAHALPRELGEWPARTPEAPGDPRAR